jgi:hypothetical protein
MADDIGAWLRGHRQVRGWTNRDMASRIIDAGQAAGDKSMPSLDTMCRNIRRWERGHGTITERYKLHYCRALDIPPAQFGTASPQAALTPVASSGMTPTGVPPQAAPVVHPLILGYRGRQEPDMGDSTVEHEVLMAAHEGSDHAEQAEEHGIGEATLEQLRADLVRLSRLTDTGEPFPVFMEMRRVRDRIYRLLDRRLWPREQTDLYFMLGCLNGLMGVTANRLGYPDAAEELNRAGFAYANAIDHRPLMAYLRGELGFCAYGRGRFDESRDLALSGLQYVSAGPHGARLHLCYAWAVARLGDADAARQAVRDAHEARESEYHDELLEIGGDYILSEATHYGEAGAALTATVATGGEAAAELERALGLYDQGPGPGEVHWFAGKPLAGIDLAVVRLRSGALDAAATALEPALSLPPAQRISRVTTRLAAVREELSAPIFHGSRQARDLGAQIEEFGREAVTAGLHSLSG